MIRYVIINLALTLLPGTGSGLSSTAISRINGRQNPARYILGVK